MREISSAAVDLRAYEDAIAVRDTSAAKAVVTQILGAGADPVDVLTDIIAAAQREVGARWQRGEWSVAEEHAATAMAVEATKVVATHVRRIPVSRGRVLVACAEREWHALPAMIIDTALRAHGWDTTLLGASTSPLRLNQYLQDLGPEAVAVSCSVLGALPTTRRFIDAATSAGVPVVVGGPAFGSDDRRARALGATAWARDAHGAVAAVATLPAVVSPAPPLPPAVAAEVGALELDHKRLFAALNGQWSLIAEVGSRGQQSLLAAREVAGDALHQILHAVAAALLTGDTRPLPETSYWIADLLRARGADPTLVGELRELLVATLGDYPLSREIVAEHFGDGST
jgi:methanogenic corrinoid protein MtbC1